MSASDTNDRGVRSTGDDADGHAPPPRDFVRARVDGDGRMVAADPVIRALQESAGGRIGGAVAVPQFAALARLVRRLKTPIERPVMAADGNRDLEFFVRARLDGNDVELVVGEWRELPALIVPDDDAREQDFLRATADWTWESDAALRVTALSDAALRLLARDGVAAPVGQPLARLFRLVENADDEMPLLLGLAEQSSFEDQRVLLRSCGRRFRLTGRPIRGPNAVFRGFQGTGQLLGEHGNPDMPARTNAFADSLDRALRRPLDRIIARAESIRAQDEGPVTPDYIDYAGDIATAGRHLLGLVDDLVDLEAIERPDFRPPAERIDLADLVRRAAGLLGVRAAEKSIRVERPSDGLSTPALGDFRRTLQILVNLIGNAIRFSPAGSTMRVEIANHGRRVDVTVADEGPGIARRDQAKIFEKFERLNALEPGTGLGLYIARKLARAMDGDLTVDSKRGKGARFTLSLPAAD